MDDIRAEIVSHIPRLRRYARALLGGNADDADDLVQDCLERAVSRLHLWQPGTNLTAWLLTIMRNLFINRYNRRRSRPPEVALPEGAGEPAGADGHGARMALIDLERALARLSDEQRQVLLLVALEGLRYETAAAVLDVPVGTVMSRLSRAREALRRHMGEAGAPPGLRRVK